MAERARFTITLTVADNHTFDRFQLSMPVDHAMRISARAVDEMKMGADLGVMDFGGAVELMRTKEMRRDVLRVAMQQLAEQMCDRLEDAEGWHDASRVEPARKALGLKN